MNLFLSFAIGLSIGVFFYAGLWFTVRALLTTRHPVLLTISSFWARTIVALAGFLYAMDGSWRNALVALAGFAAGRMLLSLVLPKGETRCT